MIVSRESSWTYKVMCWMNETEWALLDSSFKSYKTYTDCSYIRAVCFSFIKLAIAFLLAWPWFIVCCIAYLFLLSIPFVEFANLMVSIFSAIAWLNVAHWTWVCVGSADVKFNKVLFTPNHMKERTPNVFVQWAKSVHNKYCTVVEFK